MRRIAAALSVLIASFATSAQERDLSGTVITEIAYNTRGDAIAIGYGDFSTSICYGYRVVIAGETEKTLSSPCSVTTISFSPDDLSIFLGDNAGNYSEWSLEPVTVIEYGGTGGEPVLSSEWNEGGLLTAIRGAITVKYAPSGFYQLSPTFISTLAFTSAKLNPGGIGIVAASEDNSVAVWSLGATKTSISYYEHSDLVHAIAWQPNSSFIATGEDSGHINVWDSIDGTTIHTFSLQVRAISTLTWSPDGAMLASASEDGTVRVWDAQTGDLIETYTYTGAVYALDWSPDGTKLAFGGADDSGAMPEVVIADAPVAPSPLTPLPQGEGDTHDD